MSTRNETTGLLSDLRSDDPDRVRGAVEELTDGLMMHARAKLGSRQNQANCQAESVVQSVLVRELGGGADSFKNEDHLHGRLRRAVENKIRDRRKGPKGATGQASQMPAGALTDPEAVGPGIGTRVAETDRDHDVALRLTAGFEPQDVKLVRMCVLDDLDGNEAARRLSLTPDAVRKRLQRIRPNLRSRLVAPLKEHVSAHDWAILSACLVERMSPSKASELLGCSPQELADAHERLFRDSIAPALGDTGMLALARLLGRARA